MGPKLARSRRGAGGRRRGQPASATCDLPLVNALAPALPGELSELTEVNGNGGRRVNGPGLKPVLNRTTT